MRLRLLRERNQNTHVSNDLRGLGDDPIFSNSHPIAHLAVTGGSLPVNSNELLQKYGVIQESAVDKSHFHFRCVRLEDGKHKEQALHLLFFALELYATNSVLRFHLTQVDRLVQMLAREIRFDRESSESRVLKEWTDRQQVLSLAGPITFHLSQAGFRVTPSDKGARLSQEQVSKLIGTIYKDRQTENRKAA